MLSEMSLGISPCALAPEARPRSVTQGAQLSGRWRLHVASGLHRLQEFLEDPELFGAELLARHGCRLAKFRLSSASGKLSHQLRAGLSAKPMGAGVGYATCRPHPGLLRPGVGI